MMGNPAVARVPMLAAILSPLGAALIGMRVGDQMPYFVAGCLNVIRVQNVTRSSPNVVNLFPASRRGRPLDDDPGPTAA